MPQHLGGAVARHVVEPARVCRYRCRQTWPRARHSRTRRGSQRPGRPPLTPRWQKPAAYPAAWHRRRRRCDGGLQEKGGKLGGQEASRTAESVVGGVKPVRGAPASTLVSCCCAAGTCKAGQRARLLVVALRGLHHGALSEARTCAAISCPLCWMAWLGCCLSAGLQRGTAQQQQQALAALVASPWARKRSNSNLLGAREQRSERIHPTIARGFMPAHWVGTVVANAAPTPIANTKRHLLFSPGRNESEVGPVGPTPRPSGAIMVKWWTGLSQYQYTTF